MYYTQNVSYIEMFKCLSQDTVLKSLGMEVAKLEYGPIVCVTYTVS